MPLASAWESSQQPLKQTGYPSQKGPGLLESELCIVFSTVLGDYMTQIPRTECFLARQGSYGPQILLCRRRFKVAK